MASRRPDLNLAITALFEDVATRMPEFGHVRPERVIVVAGEARRASRGAVKPLTFAGARGRDALGNRKPIVRVHGKRMLYCITLRPLFFRGSTAHARVGTLIHELFHVSVLFDGTLDASHRHATMGPAFDTRMRPLLRRYLRHCPPELLGPFGYTGEVRIQQWLERPPASYSPARGRVRRVYSEAQLFQANVRMVTPALPLRAMPKPVH